MENKIGFLYENWTTFNLLIIGVAIIAIIIALLQKDSTKMKIINVFVISFVPLLGSIYFFSRMIYVSLKEKKY
jgi:hypothetical protein